MTREQVIALEDLADTVEQISEGVKAIRRTGISEKALVMLIRAAAPASKRPTFGQVAATIKGMESLRDFVFPGEGDESA